MNDFRDAISMAGIFILFRSFLGLTVTAFATDDRFSFLVVSSENPDAECETRRIDNP
jgi:hypothetical protein